MGDFDRKATRAIRSLFYGIFFLAPLVLFPKTFELFEFNKLWTIYTIALIILFLWVGKMIVSKKIIITKTPFDIPIALFFLSQVFATFFSIDPYVSFWGYYSRFNGGLLSIGTYIFLYYAFLSNFLPEKESEELEEKINPLYVSFAFISIVVGAFLVSVSEKAGFLQNIFLLLTFITPCIFFIKGFVYPPVKKLFLIMLCSGLVVALWGFTSHFGYDFTCLIFRGSLDVACWTDAFQPTVRLFSTLGQPNWLAAYFSILIPISMALGIYKLTNTKISNETPKQSFLSVVQGKKNIQAFSLIGLSLLFFIEILWSQSQSGYLGILAGLFTFFVGILYFILRHTKIKNIYKNLIIKSSVIIIILFFLTSFFMGNPLQGRIPVLSLSGFMQTFTPTTPLEQKINTKTQPIISPEELGGSDSGKIRLVVWRGALDLFKKHPLFGTGVETFAYSYYSVKPQEHNLLSEWDFLYNKAHNEYINYLATTGAIGFGTYLLMIFWFLIYTVKYLFNRSHINNLPVMLVLALLASYITILVSNFFGFSVVVINLYLFFIPALVLVLTGRIKKTNIPEGEMSPGKALLLIVFGVFCLFLLMQLLNFWFADQNYSMGYNLNRAQQYGQANKYLEDAVNLYPSEDLYKNELALNYAAIALLLTSEKQQEQAQVYLKRAVQMSADVIQRHPKNIVYYKSRVQTLFLLSELDKKYFDEALQALKKAKKLAPTDAKLLYNEGLLYGQKNDYDNAKKAFTRAIELKANYRDARYAMAVYLNQEAKQETNLAQKQKLIHQAQGSLTYILNFINQNDKQASELLENIK